MVASDDLVKFRIPRGSPGKGESSDGIPSSMRFEKKGHDAIIVNNLTNMIFTTIVEGPLYVSPRNRRFVFFHCSSIHLGDAMYITTMVNYMKDPRVARAMYQYLMKQDISMHDDAWQLTRPITQYYENLRQSNIPVLSRYLSSLIIKYDTDVSVHEMGVGELYSGYRAYYNEYMEGKDLSKILGKNDLTRQIDTCYKEGGGIEKARTQERRFWRIDPVLLKARLVASREFDEDPTPW